MEHTSIYAQSMDQKELFARNLMYWCRWIHKIAQEPYEK